MVSGLKSWAVGALVALLVVNWISGSATAHEIRPAIIAVEARDAGLVQLDVTVNLEALIAGIGPDHADSDSSPNALSYNTLRELPAERLVERFRAHAPTWINGIVLTVDGRVASLALSGIDVPETENTKLARISKVTLVTAPLPGATMFTLAYDRAFGSSVVRSRNADGKISSGIWLKDGTPSPVVRFAGAEPRTRAQIIAEYVYLGFAHIVPKGLDHILFILGLYFLNPAWRPLLTQMTVFTIAHTITLALGMFGQISISPHIVEPLIAASIVYVAVENLATSRMTMWRPLVVFAFGLLHGLGFASVLGEVGPPPGEYLTGLIAFNVGVEGGQLAVIALAWMATGFWFSHRRWYRGWIAQPASVCIAVVGAYWTLQRVFLE